MIKFEGKINGYDYKIECEDMEEFERVLDMAIIEKELTIEGNDKIISEEALKEQLDILSGYSDIQKNKIKEELPRPSLRLESILDGVLIDNIGKETIFLHLYYGIEKNTNDLFELKEGEKIKYIRR